MSNTQPTTTNNFYINVEQYGNKIYHRYWDYNQNKKCFEIVSNFNIELFQKIGQDKPSQYKSLLGEKLQKIEFDNINDAKTYIKNYNDFHPIYGQEQFEYQFIRQNYPHDVVIDISKFNILNIDIENAFGQSQYSINHKIQIQSKIENDGETKKLTIKDFEYSKNYNIDDYLVFDEELDKWIDWQDTCYKFTEGFPSPDKANQEILAITLKLFGENNYFITLGLKEYKNLANDKGIYVQCDTEKELLLKFIHIWKKLNIDILTGWNIMGYDIPYIINRIQNVLGKNHHKELSPLYPMVTNPIREIRLDTGDNGYDIMGITIHDYLALYKKFSGETLTSYSLNNVSAHEEIGEKLDYSSVGNLMDLYEKDFETYILYNRQDVRLPEKLENKKRFIELAITLTAMVKAKHKDAMSPVRIWETHLYNGFASKNICVPPKKQHHLENKIEGGYVKEPIPGFYPWVLTKDATSEYPMIISGFNMSPETLVSGAVGRLVEKLLDKSYNTDFLKRDNLCMVANGTTFRRDVRGEVPILIDALFLERKSDKTKMLSIKKEIETIKIKGNYDKTLIETMSIEANIYGNKEQAKKILLNSLFGAFSNIHFRYFDVNIAEGITLTGQTLIRFVSENTNRFLQNNFNDDSKDLCLYCDTDSFFLYINQLVTNSLDIHEQRDNNKVADFIIKWDDEVLNPFVKSKCAELADYLNAYENKFDMKREKIISRALLRGKKNYILRIVDSEGVRYQEPKFSATGVEYRRSSTPDYLKNPLEDTYRIMLDHDTQNPDIAEKQLQDYMKTFKQEYMQKDLVEIAFPRGVSDIDKWVDSKNNLLKGAPIHVKASYYYNKQLKKTGLYKSLKYIKNGDKMKFIYLKVPNHIGNNAIGFIDHIPKEFDLEKYIDKETQYEKSFFNPVKSFSDLLGWQLVKKNTMSGMFNSTTNKSTITKVEPKKKETKQLATHKSVKSFFKK